MYTILKHQGAKKFLKTEMPALGCSLLIAEGFYEFGSFLLECTAFLATWYIVSLLFNRLLPAKKKLVNRIT